MYRACYSLPKRLKEHKYTYECMYLLIFKKNWWINHNITCFTVEWVDRERTQTSLNIFCFIDLTLEPCKYIITKKN